jgi:hypothetical protein
MSAQDSQHFQHRVQVLVYTQTENSAQPEANASILQSVYRVVAVSASYAWSNNNQAASVLLPGCRAARRLLAYNTIVEETKCMSNVGAQQGSERPPAYDKQSSRKWVLTWIQHSLRRHSASIWKWIEVQALRNPFQWLW